MTEFSSTLAEAKGATWKNVFQPNRCVCVCIFCMGFHFQAVKSGTQSAEGGKGRTPCRAVSDQYEMDKPTKNDHFFIDPTGRPTKNWDRHARASKYLMGGTKKSLAAANILTEVHERRVRAGKATPAVALADVVKKLEDAMFEKAASWVSILGDYGSIHYGCSCIKEALLAMQPSLRHIPWVMAMLNDPDVEIYLLMATARWYLLCSEGYLPKTATTVSRCRAAEEK